MTQTGRTFLCLLTADDIAALDGRSDTPNVLKHMAEAKAAIAARTMAGDDPIGAAIANIIGYGIANGKIIWFWTKGTCDVCHRARLVTLYKSGPQKGRVKEFLDYSVRNYGPLSVCDDCDKELAPRLVVLLTGAPGVCRFEWPVSLTEPLWEKVHRCHCRACNTEFWEHEMGWLPAVMEGYYRGRCPNCGAGDTLFSAKITKDFSIWQVVERKPTPNDKRLGITK
ncbi:MAG: hypothetical protein KGL39_20665 [Patescibacteria group bacterium]|nr:hypothetical protein [Patescibacteria group bacterium]